MSEPATSSMFRSSGPFVPPFVLHIVLSALTVLLLALPANAFAQSADNPSGLPLPRFATTRSEPVNVRVGPGTRYDIAWTYVKAGQPVEIIQEFDVWRKVRDVDGDTGWIHQSLLSGDRAGLVMPWAESGRTALRASADAAAPVIAWLTAHFKVAISGCDGSWCQVTARSDGNSYSGFIDQKSLWGVYPGEKFG